MARRTPHWQRAQACELPVKKLFGCAHLCMIIGHGRGYDGDSGYSAVFVVKSLKCSCGKFTFFENSP